MKYSRKINQVIPLWKFTCTNVTRLWRRGDFYPEVFTESLAKKHVSEEIRRRRKARGPQNPLDVNKNDRFASNVLFAT